jgi:hypothetical protein
VLSLTEGTRRTKGTAVEDEGDPSGGSVVCDMLVFRNDDEVNGASQAPSAYEISRLISLPQHGNFNRNFSKSLLSHRMYAIFDARGCEKVGFLQGGPSVWRFQR